MCTDIMAVEQTIHNILPRGAGKSSVIKYIQPHPHVLHSCTTLFFNQIYTHVEFTYQLDSYCMGHNTPISHHNSSIPLHSPLYTGDQLYHIPPGKM